MGNPLLEILIIVVLLLLNGAFALSETAIVSARRVRLQAMADEGDPGARIALETAQNPLDFLSSVQIGITLIGVLAGVFGGATFAAAISLWLQTIPLLAPYSDAIGFAVIVVVITYLSLVIGELVPKQIALKNPERIAALVAPPMKFIARITSPIVTLLTASTRLVFRLLRISTVSESSVTLAEVQTMVEQATQEGVFEAAEQEMFEGIFKLDYMRVGNLMTPRRNVIWLAVDDPVDEIYQTLTESRRSRFPVVEEDLDDVLGIVQAKDFVHVHQRADTISLRDMLKPALHFPESMSALQAIQEFKKSRIHFAFVINEYGGVEGIITPNDILEAIVGDIDDVDEVDTPGIVVREDGSWLLDGTLSVERVKDVLDVDALPGQETYQTLGGFILHQLATIPVIGENFVWDRYRFEVVDMDGLRIDQVLVERFSPDDTLQPPTDQA